MGAGRVQCVVETSLSGVGAHATAWDELARRALDDNLYLGRPFVSAMLRHHGDGIDPRIVFVYADPARSVEPTRSIRSRRLIAVAAFGALRRSVALPISGLTTLSSPHAYLSFPLIDRDAGVVAITGLCDYLDTLSDEFDFVALRDLPEKTHFWSLLQREMRRRRKRVWIKERGTRALLRPVDSFDQYLAGLGSSRRRGYQRRLRRLREQYDVGFRLHRDQQATSDLAGRFMELEARSWKGGAGTALASTSRDQKFLEEWIASLDRAGSLFCVEVLADGEPIAMTLNFSQGRTLFAFKVAYDPDFATFSPGIIAEVETVRFAHEQGAFDCSDSGTSGASYLDDYWNDSTAMLFVLWPLGGVLAGWKLRAVEGLTELKRAVGAAAEGLRSGKDPFPGGHGR